MFIFFLDSCCHNHYSIGTDLKGKTIAWVGDGNNVLHDLSIGSIKQGMNVHIATPLGYDPDASVMER